MMRGVNNVSILFRDVQFMVKGSWDLVQGRILFDWACFSLSSIYL